MKQKIAFQSVAGMILSAGCLLVLSAGAQENSPPKLPPARQLELLNSCSDSLVQVEYKLRFDKGDSPQICDWGERCPNCGSFHAGGDGEEYVKEERPMEKPGFLLAPNLVLTSDVMIQPRFLEAIHVRLKDQTVAASIRSYAKTKDAVLLELAEPLAQSKPITFDPTPKGPYLLVSYQRANGMWTKSIQPLSGAVCARSGGASMITLEQNGLILSSEGVPVGLCMDGFLPLDDSWKGSPLDWPFLSEQDMKTLQDELRKKTDQSLLRITLHFRSPKAGEASSPFRRYMSDEEENQSATEIHTVGVLFQPQDLLILAKLKAGTTARLEKITVFPPAGDPIPARFAGTLKNYGALLARLEKPLDSCLTFSDKNILDYQNTLLPAVELLVQGETRTAYFTHQRLFQYQIGWRQQIYPRIPGRDQHRFLFDDNGNLVAMPVHFRQRVSTEENRWEHSEPVLTAAGYLKSVVEHPAEHLDAVNIPLTEEQENRLAWMGVELQPLNQELARIHKISDITRDGEIGAMVSYVYPDSPAARAQIQPGAILLRLHAKSLPKPVEMEKDEDSFFMDDFPWDQFDEFPEQFFERMPTPWPNVENFLNQTLTDIGFDTPYQAEFVIDGKRVMKDLLVEQSPPHYNSAPKYKSESLGMTLKNLTYEVRRYLQLQPADPGVVVSKIEPGSKSAVAGIRPYELITHVNDEPVSTIQDLERLIQNQKELKLSVKRKTIGRIVNIVMPEEPAK